MDGQDIIIVTETNIMNDVHILGGGGQNWDGGPILIVMCPVLLAMSMKVTVTLEGIQVRVSFSADDFFIPKQGIVTFSCVGEYDFVTRHVGLL